MSKKNENGGPAKDPAPIEMPAVKDKPSEFELWFADLTREGFQNVDMHQMSQIRDVAEKAWQASGKK